jgi:hypothetical protein
MATSRSGGLGEQSDDLDLLWVATVPDDELQPPTIDPWGNPSIAPFDHAADHRPVHGTMTVDVRDSNDRTLLERLLNTGRVLSVTASDGWSQQVRLTGIKCLDTEEQSDGSQVVIATYHWVAAASFN